MSGSVEFTQVDTITSGTVGPPGQRVFFLQATEKGNVVSLRMEKQQLAALCEHLGAMMADLPEVITPVDTAGPFHEPDSDSWSIGSMGVAYEHATDSVLLVAEELIVEQLPMGDLDPDEFADPDVLAEELLEQWGLADTEPATARLHVPRALVAPFVEHSRLLISAGRPTCDLCGNPVDPTGHPCPRLN